MSGISAVPGSSFGAPGAIRLRLSRRSLGVAWILASVVAGLGSVFMSTDYLTQFEKWHVVMPWRFPAGAIIPFLLSGVFLCCAIVADPTLFWPVLMAANVLASGIFVLRFSVLDEWLTAWVALGGVVAVLAGTIPRRVRVPHGGWAILFMILMAHLVLASLAGYFLYDNVKALRFVLIYGTVSVTAFLVIFYDFPIPSSQKINSLLVRLGTAFSVLYLVHAAVFYTALKCSIIDGIGYASTGYQVAPFIVTLPAALIAVSRSKGRDQFWGIVNVALSLLVVAMTDSRAGLLVVIVSFALLPFAFGFWRAMKLFFISALIFPVVGILTFGTPQWVLNTVDTCIQYLHFEGGSSTWYYLGKKVTTAKGDGGRYLFFKTGCRFLVRDFPVPALTGAGTYGYFIAAKDHFIALTRETRINSSGIHAASGVDQRKNVDPNVDRPRPPAAGALLVETGWIGLFLLMGSFVMTFSKGLFRTTSEGRTLFRVGPNVLITSSLVSVLGFSFFTELQDIVFIYLLIVPFGLIHSWCRDQ